MKRPRRKGLRLCCFGRECGVSKGGLKGVLREGSIGGVYLVIGIFSL